MVLGLVGLLVLLEGDSFGLFTLVLGLILYQASGGAVMQGAMGQRIQSVTREGHHGSRADHDPGRAEAARRPGAVLRPLPQPLVCGRRPRPPLPRRGALRAIDAEIAAGRPALEVGDVLEQDLQVRIDEHEPLESLLRSEGLGRLGGMVAVDADGILRGTVTVAQIRQALNPAGGR